MKAAHLSWLLVSSVWAMLSSAHAACNNPANWLESPAQGVTLVFGYKQDLDGFGSTITMTGVDRKVYPETLTLEQLKGFDRGRLVTDEELEADTSSTAKLNTVSYYEPDEKGQWRLCRREQWHAVKPSTDPWKVALTQKNQARNSLLRSSIASHYMASATAYLYDKKGRIVERFVANPEERKGLSTGLRKCTRYDHKDRVVLFVEVRESHTCPQSAPDVRDDWRQFRFVDSVDGQTGHMWSEEHSGKPDGSWHKYISFVISPHVDKAASLTLAQLDEGINAGNATVISDRGLIKILGGFRIGLKDKSDNYKFPYSTGKLPPIEYFFPVPPVPMSVLTNIDEMYKYPRRRETSVTSGIKMLEFYEANEHHVRERFYSGFNFIIRHEHLNDKGQLKRVINLLMVGLNPRNGGFYEEDLPKAKLWPILKGRQLYYRVWDYDQTGKATLVAIGYNDDFTLGKTPLHLAKMVFRSMDGKTRWATETEFFKAFGFDPMAKRAHPASEYRD